MANEKGLNTERRREIFQRFKAAKLETLHLIPALSTHTNSQNHSLPGCRPNRLTYLLGLKGGDML